MIAIILVVFLAVFALIALVFWVATGSQPSKQVRATLASALKASSLGKREEVVDVRKRYSLSSIPWLHNLLAQIQAAIELGRILDQADLNWTPGRLILTCVACWMVSAYLIDWKIGLGLASLLPALAFGILPYGYVIKRRARRFREFQQKLPEALDLMVSALRAGHSMVGALGAAARESPEPIGREFRICFEEQNFGIDLRTAIENLIDRVPLQDVRMITTAMLINKESGGNLSEVLEKTAQVIRERFRLQQQIRVHTAQGRLTGWVLSLLPVILGTVLYLENPAYMKVLFTHPGGQKALALAVAMNLTGLLVIRKIVNVRI
jgi:tight adherence protein B